MASSGEATASRRRLLALVGPIATVAAAYVLWWISDRLSYIGPLDRAAFGWLVVMPVLLASPVVAGVAWRRLGEREQGGAALAAGGVVGLASAFLFWRAVAASACETAPVRTAIDWILPSLVLGAFVGAGLAVGGFAAARLLRTDRRLAAVAAAVGVDVLVLALALVFLGTLLAGAGCQRPVPIG